MAACKLLLWGQIIRLCDEEEQHIPNIFTLGSEGGIEADVAWREEAETEVVKQ